MEDDHWNMEDFAIGIRSCSGADIAAYKNTLMRDYGALILDRNQVYNVFDSITNALVEQRKATSRAISSANKEMSKTRNTDFRSLRETVFNLEMKVHQFQSEMKKQSATLASGFLSSPQNLWPWIHKSTKEKPHLHSQYSGHLMDNLDEKQKLKILSKIDGRRGFFTIFETTLQGWDIARRNRIEAEKKCQELELEKIFDDVELKLEETSANDTVRPEPSGRWFGFTKNNDLLALFDYLGHDCKLLELSQSECTEEEFDKCQLVVDSICGVTRSKQAKVSRIIRARRFKDLTTEGVPFKVLFEKTYPYDKDGDKRFELCTANTGRPTLVWSMRDMFSFETMGSARL